MKKFTNNIIFSYILIIFIYFNAAHAFENKILFKINNEIITSIDIFNEIEYISILNPQFKKIDNQQILEIAKNSIIREKIKKIEIKKNFKEIKIDDNYLDKIILSSFSGLNLNSYDELIVFLKTKNIEPSNVKEKISIEVLWNQLIYDKFSKQIKIDPIKIKKELENLQEETNSYLLSEIIFDVDSEISLNDKISIINSSINEIGFRNTALKYSISDSSSVGGELGWVDENLLNSNIQKEISKYKVGEHTAPILTSGGFLILKIENKKKITNKIDLEKIINETINKKTNQQLSQFSNIYYNKVKKNININEL